MQILIMQFTITFLPACLTFILTTILKHRQSVFFPECYIKVKLYNFVIAVPWIANAFYYLCA